MPFRSMSQLRTCYSKQKQKKQGNNTGWDCDEWLSKTNCIACLPDAVGHSPSSKKKPSMKNFRDKPTKKQWSPVMQGSRGGMYRVLTEWDHEGNVIGKWKLYL